MQSSPFFKETIYLITNNLSDFNNYKQLFLLLIKKYYILLIFRNRDGHKTYEQVEVETLSGEVVENGD